MGKPSEVYQGVDGYWRVRGLPEATYYADKETAERVAVERARAAEELAPDEVLTDEEADAHADEVNDQIRDTE